MKIGLKSGVHVCQWLPAWSQQHILRSCADIAQINHKYHQVPYFQTYKRLWDVYRRKSHLLQSRQAHGEADGSFLSGSCWFLRPWESSGYFLLKEVPSTPSLHIPISSLLPGGRLALTGRDRPEGKPPASRELPSMHPTGPRPELCWAGAESPQLGWALILRAQPCPGKQGRGGQPGPPDGTVSSKVANPPWWLPGKPGIFRHGREPDWAQGPPQPSSRDKMKPHAPDWGQTARGPMGPSGPDRSHLHLPAASIKQGH